MNHDHWKTSVNWSPRKYIVVEFIDNDWFIDNCVSGCNNLQNVTNFCSKNEKIACAIDACENYNQAEFIIFAKTEKIVMETCASDLNGNYLLTLNWYV